VLGHFLRERVSGGAGGDGEGDAVRRQVTCEALAPGQRLHLTQKKRGVEASKVAVSPSTGEARLVLEEWTGCASW
jgi:hypothetical protein